MENQKLAELFCPITHVPQGSIFYIMGENFGRKELKDVSVIVGDTNFPVLEHNHTFMVVESQPGQGKLLSIQVRVVDALSKPAETMYTYSKPLVHRLLVNGHLANSSNPMNVPTTGRHKNGVESYLQSWEITSAFQVLQQFGLVLKGHF